MFEAIVRCFDSQRCVQAQTFSTSQIVSTLDVASAQLEGAVDQLMANLRDTTVTRVSSFFESSVDCWK